MPIRKSYFAASMFFVLVFCAAAFTFSLSPGWSMFYCGATASWSCGYFFGRGRQV